MNYELAQELKEAGFPQYYPWKCGCDGPVSCSDHMVIKPNYAPTLSEIIEACGRPIMIRCREDGSCQAFNDLEGFACDEGGGLTPEEAVARLWIALNKKEKES